MPSSKIITCIRCGEKKNHHAHELCKNCYDQIREEWRGNRTEYFQTRGKILNRKNYRKNRQKIRERRKDQYREYNKKVRSPRTIYAYHNFKKIPSTSVYPKNGYWFYNPSKKAVHIAIAEKALGRRLKRPECVHHIDGNGLNNRHENLLICDNSFHRFIHNKMRTL